MNLINIIERLQQIDCNGGNMILLIVIAASLIQISPIKINPWTWCRDRARDLIGLNELKIELQTVKENMDELDSKIDNLKKEDQERRDLSDALSSRRRILRFNDELLQNIRHSQEMFNNILEDITDYDHYCNTHRNFVNQRAVLAESNIKKTYQKCMEEHDFL